MTCEEIRIELTQAVVEGHLDREPNPEIEAHLVVCSQCRAEAKSLGALWGDLAELAGEVPSERLRTRFEGLLDSYAASEVPMARPLNQRARRHLPLNQGRSSWTVFAAAACLVLGIGVGRWSARQPVALPAGELASLQREVGSLNQLVALSLLRQESAASRLEGVRFGRQIDSPSEEVLSALSERVVRDPNTNVRLAAVEALAPLAERDEVQQLLASALAQQESPIVQIALIDLLMASGTEASREAVDDLFNDPSLHSEVRRHIVQRGGGEA